jgi:ParB-like chromosome segregation protein Spo0J
VVALDAVPAAVEACRATGTGEGTSDEEEPRGRFADAGRDETAERDEAAERAPIVEDVENEQGSRGEELCMAIEPMVGGQGAVQRDGAGAESGLRCARCGREGVEAEGEDDDIGDERRVRRTRRASWPMTSRTEVGKTCAIGAIGTALGRARCVQPARIERMKRSLARHGQLTPVLGASRMSGVELVDGFKRLGAAERLGWETIELVVKPLDETAQWTTMLLVNRSPSSMTTLEEALVLREIFRTGLTQTEIAEMCTRHKTWVSRRIGLLERLHPELVESMKLGLLLPGTARRLLSLPPGNQLEMAAAVQSAGLGPRDTEWLVSLWRRTKDPGARRALLSEPKASLHKHHPQTRRSPPDPRLSPQGQRLSRCLCRFEMAVTETSRALQPVVPLADRALLDKDLGMAAQAACRLATELGSARSEIDAGGSAGSDGTA